MAKSTPTLFLVCTGLGKVSRGFEQYMQQLATHLAGESDAGFRYKLFTGGKVKGLGLQTIRIFNISNTSWFSRNVLGSHKGFVLEQISFFLGFVPWVIWQKPACIYLGEYLQYCYLFKIRQLLGLRFSLALYTGGQVYPGLFNPELDFVHHVTDVYLPNSQQQQHPAQRQFLVPHFIQPDFVYTSFQDELLQKAAGKKIVLSVGLIDVQVKRMDVLLKHLSMLSEPIFPILLGQYNQTTKGIQQMLEQLFGSKGYLMDCIPHPQLGDHFAVADAFVLCSLKESFGLVFLEALYHGLPVLCHDFAEARFVLGKHATFTDTTHDANFQSDLQQLLSNSNRTIQRHQFVQKSYTWQVLRPAYSAMFRQLVGVLPT